VRSHRRLLAWTLAGVLGGCLPAGEPPAGRHLVHDRTLSGVFFSPSEQDGVPAHVLALGPLAHAGLEPPYAEVAVASLYRFADAIPAATLEGLAASEPVVENLYLPNADATDAPFASDSRGRLLFVKWDPTVPPATGRTFQLRRRNLGSGQESLLDFVNILRGVRAAGAAYTLPETLLLLSPGRTQIFSGGAGAGRVIGLDTEQFLWQANDVAFIGEDFYCAGIVSAHPEPPQGTNILRVRPGETPEVLYSSTGYLGLYPVAGSGSIVPQLLLTLSTDSGTWPFALLDTETGESQSLPAERGRAEFVSASPSGRLLLFRTPSSAVSEARPVEYRLFILDWTTGGSVSLDAASVGQGLDGNCEWRPGTSDLWCATLPGGLAIWRPHHDVTTLDAEGFAYRPAGGASSVFTADGRHWFARAGSPRPTVYAGSSDDPQATLVPLNPPGTQTDRYWLVPDGRLLIEAWASDARRSDIYLVDADAGTSRALGSAGKVVAVGQKRALALLDWQLSRAGGELTLVDYTGERRILAPDVYAAAADRGPFAQVPPGSDALAPGARVAFLSRNRLESRDDGLWLAELP
jgi:hypothetical protein